MLIGVNLNHDYAHCVLNGAGITLIEEERRSRIRYHHNDSSYTLALLDRYSIEELSQVEAIYLSYPRVADFVRRHGDLSSSSRAYRYVGGFPGRDDPAGVVAGELWIDDLPLPAACVSHYHAHAASAFYPSPFSEADILCLDGGGDFGEGAFFHSDGGGLHLAQRYLDVQLGSSYHHFSQRVFGVSDGFFESKVMAIAAFGDSALCENSFMTTRGRLNSLPPDTVPSVHDIAEFQHRFEAEVLALLESAPRQSENLCCVGGCFYNVRLNAILADSGLYRQIYVPPYCGDMGTAMGAVLLAAAERALQLPPDLDSPYLGDALEVTDEELDRVIRALGDVPVFMNRPGDYQPSGAVS